MRSTLLYTLLLAFLVSITNAQYEIKIPEGYSPQIGAMVSMMEDIKNRITADVSELSQEEVDFMFDEQANSIGALLMHIISNEAYYQVESLEGRRWTDEEAALWGVAGGLGPKSQAEIKGKPVQYYLDLWDEVRSKSLEGLKTKDDEWFAAEVDEGVNLQWVWFHVLEHSSSHMGQISLVKNRLPE